MTTRQHLQVLLLDHYNWREQGQGAQQPCAVQLGSFHHQSLICLKVLMDDLHSPI